MLAIIVVVVIMIVWWYLSVKYDVLNRALDVLYKFMDRFR
jgi:hypothetical protein